MWIDERIKHLGPKRGETKTGYTGKLLVEELYDLYSLAKYNLGIKEGGYGVGHVARMR
jgi:hypothetical protein